MFSTQVITNLKIFTSHSKIFLFPYRSNAFPNPSSIKFQKIHVEVLESQAKNDEVSSKCEDRTIEKDLNLGDRNAKGDNEEKGISGIHVPRQRYISVTKKALLDGLLSMFESQDDVDSFLQVSLCLDSILHAEHKDILEEMRVDYFLTHSLVCDKSTTYDSDKSGEEEIMASDQHLAQDNYLGKGRVDRQEETEENDKPLPFHSGLDLRFLLGPPIVNNKRNSLQESSVTVATRFQHAFMKLLRDAQFEELSARDLLLTSALNTDYLLTLPIYVDWKRASESNVIIFRRGYATERQKGLLIVEKLDYLQSKLLQGIFFILSRPLKQIGTWINESLKNASQTEELQVWLERVKPFLKDPPSSQRSHAYAESTFSDQSVSGKLSAGDPPIWFAAQRAVSLYEGLLSSAGPRGRLLRKVLMSIGLIPPIPETSFDIDNDSAFLEPYLRPNFLSRITLSDIWEPATRGNCGNNLMEMLRTAISIFFSQSVLQEPAFQELILFYTEETGQMDCKVEVPTLQLKIYERIPIPDLPVIFPHKKLSFRILDTVRLDIASILGLLAFFVNYKFEDILSSPSAFLLDVIAISALIIYVTRVALGYKQTWDRYQLLVNRTLYEKTLASGFGSVHFLLDASEQQQYKEAILAYGLLQADNCQVHSGKSIRETCERFMYDKFNEKIEMPIDKAMETLLRLGLVTEVPLDGNVRIQAVPCSEAYETLKQRWNGLLG